MQTIKLCCITPEVDLKKKTAAYLKYGSLTEMNSHRA